MRTLELTDLQRQCVELRNQGFSHRDISNKIGVAQSGVTRHLQAAEKKAEKLNADPGFSIYERTKGRWYIDPESGEKRCDWDKTRRDKQDVESLQESFRAAVEDVKPLPLIKKPKINLKDSFVGYPMGDPHIGLYAWRQSAGEDFDCDIAERDLLNASDYLMSCTPNTEKCLIGNLGDFFNADNKNNTTTAGTQQDVDGRWPRVLKIGISIMIRMIERALEKHQHVTVVNALGNHDEHTSIMLTVCLQHAFSKNKRVTIQDTYNSFHYFEFGKVLLGINHGDKIKKPLLPGIMAGDQPEAWGRTIHRHWWTGHVHHTTGFADEHNGCIVESFRTLAARSDWTHNQGYRAGRDMNAIVYHKEYGETDRHRCDILRARA